MARKFLYFVAFCIVVFIAGRIALTFYADELTSLAFVPSAEFTPQPELQKSVYEQPGMWISRPGLGAADPSGWLPAGVTTPAEPVPAAVFFVHPTSFTDRDAWNAPLDDATASQRAEIFVRGLASPFNASQSLWAPRYRQATIGAFLTGEPAALRALDLAYGDVLQAFDTFVAATDPATPIVLAGHSQGAAHVLRLLKERVAGQSLAKRVVAVYAIGWPVSRGHDLPATGLAACAQPQQTGCIISWAAYAEPGTRPDAPPGAPASVGLDGKSRFDEFPVCTNPLTGAEGGSAPASANLGTLFPNADLTNGVIHPGKIPARCSENGMLLIGPPPELGPFVLPGNNYHVYDIPLFWMNLRADFGARVAAWKP